MKTNLKDVLKFAGKFVKGAAKGVPFVGPVLDGIENATKKEIVTGEPKSHDQLVWIAELVGVAAFVAFLVYKNIIPQDVLLKVIEAIINAIL